MMSCEDKVRDRISSTTTENDMAKFRAEVEACAVKCADEHVGLVPGLTKKLIENLSRDKL